ncbi:cytochrome P450-like protein [Dichomitus squalens]|nr:cytochrome P450-like protein [Dichomitus squalens]
MDTFRFTFIPSSTFLIENVPFLRYMPPWFPGAGFQATFETWRAASERMVEQPYVRAKANMNAAESTDTIVGAALGSGGLPAEEREMIIKNVACVTYVAGVDTTLRTLSTFFLASNLFPEAQKKAQAELYAVVGTNRLPDYPDRDRLPYVNALIRECHRWLPTGPLSLPHATLEDDEYDGYFIPAGAAVLPNIS